MQSSQVSQFCCASRSLVLLTDSQASWEAHMPQLTNLTQFVCNSCWSRTTHTFLACELGAFRIASERSIANGRLLHTGSLSKKLVNLGCATSYRIVRSSTAQVDPSSCLPPFPVIHLVPCYDCTSQQLTIRNAARQDCPAGVQDAAFTRQQDMLVCTCRLMFVLLLPCFPFRPTGTR